MFSQYRTVGSGSRPKPPFVTRRRPPAPRRRNRSPDAWHTSCSGPWHDTLPRAGHHPAIATAGNGFAQDLAISGTVVDARTARPLARVLVAVEGQSVFTETDDQGRFTLTVPQGSERLVISLVGYALQRYTLNPGSPAAPLEIALAEGAGPFEQQLTVAGSAAPEAESTPAGATLHGREFQALRGVTLDDPMRALHALPAATSTDDFYSEFSIRGLDFSTPA